MKKTTFKKVLCIILGVMLLCSLAACGSKEQSGTTAPGSAVQTTKAADESKSNGTEESGKTLVVYFSATGSTKRVAEVIAQKLGADIFEIEPADPYTSDDLNYNNKESRVSLEHDDETKRAVELKKDTPDGWEDYDTVYIGYPVWWGISAWPADSFVQKNSFEGKTVVPFCTSASSALGDSANLLSKKADGGLWHAGKRFGSQASESEVSAWVEEIK